MTSIPIRRSPTLQELQEANEVERLSLDLLHYARTLPWSKERQRLTIEAFDGLADAELARSVYGR